MMTPASVSHLDAVRGRFGPDQLAAADLERQRGIGCTVGAVAERHPVQPGGDVDLRAGREVLAGAPVRSRTFGFVRQPRPTALDRRVGGDLQGPLHRGLVADRRVELQDDRRRHADDLAVGELELAVDLVGRGDRGEGALHRYGLAVATHHRAAPAVFHAVAEWLGGVERAAVAAERTGDDPAVRIGQRDPLKPAVADLQADRGGRQHIGGGVVRRERHRGRRRRRIDGLFAGPAEAGCQSARGDHADRERGQGPPPVHRRHRIGGTHVDPRYLERAANQ